MTFRTPPRLAPLLLFSLLALAGCTTEPKPQATAKAGDDEWVTLPPRTGSNVPRRVRKADLLAGKVPDAGAAVDVDKDQFAQGVRPGVKLETGK